MAEKVIGTILHGALGDYYEQLLAIRIERESRNGEKWIGFYKEEREFRIISHFNIDMLEECYPVERLQEIQVDEYFQFQVKDSELRADIFDKLPRDKRAMFDLKTNNKPWAWIRKHDFASSGLELSLSALGKEFLPVSMQLNGIDESIFGRKFTVGYLWRYRSESGAVKNYFQKSADWIIKSKSELFRRLINENGAHIFVAGMHRQVHSPEVLATLTKYGFHAGSYKGKYTDMVLDLPPSNVTYLKGVGFAAEMELMSRCDLLVMMPSGFSEALWMKRKVPVLLTDPPPGYLAKMVWNRMPLFDNLSLDYAYNNMFVSHTADNMMKFLEKKALLSKKRRR